ncbi:RNA-directed DNA polymerase [Priestia megaterium]|uniref:RNA-directed DNA polymerase n=1 Tax=Priestia megaterium TaxID=1404 RepID=UPI001867E29B|nr:RNA-directed DNA polymerase [Priestia megaterium]MBE2975809.1 RNA-directed DNA polymerase [Priestia megaterium]
MKKYIKFNRQTNDFLLTDLLPYEKGNHYTHIYLYEYLQNNKKAVNNLIKKIRSENNFFKPSWHSAPLKFKISKARGDFREISLINPMGLVESLAFMNLFESDIVNILHSKNDFSMRKAGRVNSLIYKKRNKQTVYYTDISNSKKQLLISLESKGTYFRHYPFKTVTQLLNSKRFTYSRDSYKLLMIVDIQDCFSSIYSHSYKWLISSKVYDSKSLTNSNSIYKNIDVFLQNLNGSKTNGIIVGPELNRLLAEFLLVHIDQELIEILAEKNIITSQDYTIYRFVDDYYIYTNEQEVQNTIKEELANLLNKFQLKINESKVKEIEKNENLNEWVLEISPIITLIEQIFMNDTSPFLTQLKSIKLSSEELNQAFLQVATAILDAGELGESKQIKLSNKKVRYIDLRSRVNSVLLSTQEASLISSYILSTILKKIEDKKDNQITLNMEVNELITFIFFIYTKKITYSSTQKVIRILTLLLEKEVSNAKLIIERSIERFANDIFKGYSSDWIDLILFFSSYRINLTATLTDSIANIIIKEQNPIKAAALCLFYETRNITASSFVKKINELVKNKIESINWDDFFQDELGWWVFIFISYPKINKKTKEIIINNLRKIMDDLKSTPSDDAKLIILNFLINNDMHFIEWGFTKDNYHKQFYFYTKDRTVFNPDIIDQINISR